MNQPTIFLLEEDNDVRPVFRRVIEENGYKVLLAVDEKDALQRAGDGLTKSDLILINLLDKSEEEMLAFGKRLSASAGLSVPLIVIAAEYGEELEGTMAQVGENEYIVYLGAGEELFDLLSGLSKIKRP